MTIDFGTIGIEDVAQPWRRLAARLVDTAGASALFGLGYLVLSFEVLVVLFLVLTCVMPILFTWYGQSPGKMLLRIRTVDVNGQPPSMGSALVRWLTEPGFAAAITIVAVLFYFAFIRDAGENLVSDLFFLLVAVVLLFFVAPSVVVGEIIAAGIATTDQQRRTFHDRCAGTWVVRADAHGPLDLPVIMRTSVPAAPAPPARPPATTASGAVLAGFGDRFGATLLDALIVWIPWLFLVGKWHLWPMAMLAGLAIETACLCVGKHSPGKNMTRLEVVNRNGDEADLLRLAARAALRWLLPVAVFWGVALLVSSPALTGSGTLEFSAGTWGWASLAMVAWTAVHIIILLSQSPPRAVHDWLCRTIVVRCTVEPAEPVLPGLENGQPRL